MRETESTIFKAWRGHGNYSLTAAVCTDTGSQKLEPPNSQLLRVKDLEDPVNYCWATDSQQILEVVRHSIQLYTHRWVHQAVMVSSKLGVRQTTLVKVCRHEICEEQEFLPCGKETGEAS